MFLSRWLVLCTLFLALFLAVAVAGCGADAQVAASPSPSPSPPSLTPSPSPSLTPSPTPSLSPSPLSLTPLLSPTPWPSAYAAAEAVLCDYYTFISSGQFAKARALISPQEQVNVAGDPSLQGLTDLRFKLFDTGKRIAKGGPAEWAQYADLCEIEVNYVTHSANPIGEPAGEKTRFAILGRLPSKTQWLLVDLPGTGP